MRIDDNLYIDERALTERFVRASGPGGQNVNKVATAVQLRLDLRRVTLPDDVRARLVRLAGRRLTTEDELVIEAGRFRTQERNREDARERLAALIRKALVAPKPRRPTKPTMASKRRRLESKSHRSSVKSARSKPAVDD